MLTRIILVPGLLLCTFASFASTEHGSSINHGFTLQADSGEGRDASMAHWDLDGWVGDDNHKLWLKSEGEKVSATTETSELWALYSHNIDTFWDAQLGLRYDDNPAAMSYIVVGVNGLAPYFLETEIHLFASDDGDISLRWREERDFLLTQRWIIKPYAEFNLLPGDAEGEAGFQLRYEITRKFAPYVDLHHTRNDDGEDLIAALGLQLIF